MTDLLSEDLLTLAAACRLYPGARGAKSKHPKTIIRYIRKGCRADNGTLVKLEAIRDGGRLLTSREALIRFHELLSVPAGKLTRSQERAAVRAELELERMGAFTPRSCDPQTLEKR